MIDGMTKRIQTGHEPVCDAAHAAMAERFAKLAGYPLRQRLSAMMTELARLAHTELTPSQRFRLLEPLRPLIRKTTAKLPKPSAEDPDTAGAAGGATLEQHLYVLIIENLKLLLRDLDRPRYYDTEGRFGKRRWAEIYLMKTLGRQVYYAASTARRLPGGTWLELHDLFSYVLMRSEVQIREPGDAPPRGSGFDFELAYKRLLLLGFYAAIDRSRLSPTLPPIDRGFFRQLSAWALDTWLIAPQRLLQRTDLILVETTKDGPPRLERAVQHEPFRGWILVPAQAFVDLLAASRTCLLSRHLPATGE